MALTKISTGGVKDDAASQAKIADEAVDEARLQVSNAGTNGQFLQKQSGDTGGLTWATVTVPDSDKIEEGNTSIETVDTGSDGHVKITTEGTEKVRVDNSGRVLIGTSSSSSTDTLVAQGNSAGAAYGPQIRLRRNGTISSGSGIATVHFEDGSGNQYAVIGAEGDGTSGSSDYPGRIVFSTTADGASSSSERLRVGSSGQLGIAGANYGTSGQVLTSGGASAAPSWAAVPPGGNTFTAVANGAIANNKPVKLDTDGKVSEIKETLEDLSAPATISSNLSLVIQGGSLGSKFNRLARISDTQLCAIWWDSSDRIRTRLIKISNNGTSYTCHSPLTDGGQMQELADNGYIRDLDIAYDPNRNKLLAIWVEDHTIKGRVGTVNGTDVSSTITWSTTTTIESGSSAGPARRLNLVWNEDLQNFGLFFITQGSDDKTYAKVVTINSSGAIELNTTQQILPYSGEDFPIDDPSTLAATYDTTNNRYCVVVGGRQGTTRWRSGGACLSASGTGTSATLTRTSGSQSSVNLWQLESISSYPNGRHKLFQACYDSSKDLVLVSYVDVDTIGNGYNHLYVRLFKNGNSNNDFSSGSAITMVQATTSTWHLQYVAGLNKPVLTYVDSNGDIVAKILTISGTATSSSITFSSATTINSANAWQSELNEGDGGEVAQWCRGTTTASGGRVIFAAAAGSSSRTAHIIPYKVQNITPNFTVADTYIGFADQAYTNGQTVTVKTYGNNVSTLSGLTIGSKYYVQTNGTVTTSAGSPSAVAGIAIAADKLLIKEPT